MTILKYDAVIIGAGHNGLTAANYLARAGMNVCVLEQRAVIGGAALTEEFHPGYRNSTFSYVVSLLRPEVVRDLELEKYGYEPILLQNALYLDSAGGSLLLTGDESADRAEFKKFSSVDYDNYLRFEETIEVVGDLLSKQWLKEPPRLAKTGISDIASLGRLGIDVFKLDEQMRWRLLQFFLGAPESIIDRWFDSDKVKSMVAAHIMPANYAPLNQPGASLAMLHHAVGEISGHKGAWGIVKGGMGSITQAMAKSAESKGVVIRTQAAVSRVLVKNGAVEGVLLETGERIYSEVIAANTDPKRTLLTLLGKDYLPQDTVRDLAGFRQESASLRINLALSGLPEFAAIPGSDIGSHHRSTMVMIESAQHLNDAYSSARSGKPASPPIIEAIIPSVLDPDLVDEQGHHVMSLLCKYMPYDLADGAQWDAIKDEVVRNILDYLAQFIPNLRDILVAHTCYTPLDLERTLGMTRGDICHGRLEPDQLWSMRPTPELAQYSTPVTGLYLCGSGSHPGGGVTGAPGYNAARRILKDRRRV